MRILETIGALQEVGLTVADFENTGVTGSVPLRGERTAVLASECRGYGIVQSQVASLKEAEATAGELGFEETPNVPTEITTIVKTLGTSISQETVTMTAGLLRGYLETGTLCDEEGTSVRTMADLNGVTENNGSRTVIYSKRKDGNK